MVSLLTLRNRLKQLMTKINRKTVRKSSKSKLTSYIRSAQTLFAALLIAVLSAFGFMRCLDERQSSPIEPVEDFRNVKVKQTDTGKGIPIDPTLLNEDKLLDEEQKAQSKKAEVKTLPKQVEKSSKVKKDDETKQESSVTDKPAPIDQTSLKDKTPTAAESTDKTEPILKEKSIEEKFPLYGAAFQFHTQFRAEPKTDARVIGYARRGAKFRVSKRISTTDCRNGWYEISPGGLFACANQGIVVGAEPVSFAPSPPAPFVDKPLPYRYSYITADNTPQYWRIPNEDEIKEVSSLFDKMSAVEKNEEKTAESIIASIPLADTDTSEESEGEMAEIHDPPKQEDTSPEFPAYLHMRMAKGYYVSLDDEAALVTSKYRRTVRGRVIPSDRLASVSASEFEGFLISDPAMLPQVIVVGSGVSLLKQKTQDGPFQTAQKVSHLDRFDYLGEIKRQGKTYIQVGDDLFLSSRVVSIIRPQAKPKNIGPKERWIEIDLSDQSLIAYEGERPVFATVISSGRKEYPTPTGDFRIYAKHITVTMDDTEAGAESYSIEDVPWVQYFKDGYALHAAFWHGRFGRVRSHGCINLSPKDAKRLFTWTGPDLPFGVHGQFATINNPGTRILIHE